MKQHSLDIFQTLFYGLFVLLFNSCSVPQPVAVELPTLSRLDLDQPLPIDPKVKIGTLENGIRYYIRVNQKPEKRAELRLVVNAGSVLEEDDQQGLAHFVEHMGFNGTKHFPKQDLVDYLESIGMRFGPDLNAYTGFDETVYMLKVPTDSAAMVEKGFQVLADWAHGISFEDGEIEKERGVVIEEWRLGQGAETRMRDIQFPILFKNSRYAVRLPIGKKAVLDTFRYDRVKQFYKDWYRPDLMAVIAVGDFDPEWIENLIHMNFASISSPDKLKPRSIFPIPDHDETLFAIATDPEATGTRVGVYYKQELQLEQTVEDYRREIVEGLYNSMLNDRLDELTKKPESPFLYGFSYQGRFIRSKNVYVLGAGVQEKGIEKGLEALLIEAERVAKFGFTPSELNRKKKETLRHLDQAYQERDKTVSRRFASEYVSHYLSNEPIPGIEFEVELYRKYLPGVQLTDVNSLAREWVTDQNRVIMVNSPDKTGLKIPSKADLLVVFDTIAGKKITPYVDFLPSVPLVERIPKAVPIVSENRIDTLNVTLWELENGVRVFLKPTDFKNDEILFSAHSPGGHSLAPDSDYVSAMTAASLIKESGVSVFNLIELEKLLADKIVRVSPWIGSLQEGFHGSASPQDMETMFQLIYLYFTASREDSAAYLAYKSRMEGFLENRSARPETAYRDTIQVTMAQYHPRERPWSIELLAELDLETSFAFYQDRFSDASDFTFFFVGNFELEEIKTWVQTYLGSLPSIHRQETGNDVGIEPPVGVIEKSVMKGIEPKSLSQIIFTGSFEWDRQNRYDLSSMAHILRIKLREVMREDLSGTYFVSVREATSHFPDEEYQISVSFGCDPGRVKELTEVVFSQIDSLKSVGTTEKYIEKVKEIQRREREVNLKENRFWLSSLRFHDYHGEDMANILTFDEFVNNLTLEAIQLAAQRYLNTRNYVQVSLYPKEEVLQSD